MRSAEADCRLRDVSVTGAEPVTPWKPTALTTHLLVCGFHLIPSVARVPKLFTQRNHFSFTQSLQTKGSGTVKGADRKELDLPTPHGGDGAQAGSRAPGDGLGTTPPRGLRRD